MLLLIMILIFHVSSNDNFDIKNIHINNTERNHIQKETSICLDEYHELHRQVLKALICRNALHEESQMDEELGDQDDGSKLNLNGFEDLYEEATTPVYTNSKMSSGSATIILMNICTIFCLSNKFIDELFYFLLEDLLSKENKLSRSHYGIWKNMQHLRLVYNNIHTYSNR